MYWKIVLAFCAGLLAVCSADAQSNWETLKEDYQVNLYTVCDSAEAHFERNGKGEGSGWKGYQRWKYWQEKMFGPSGDRSQADPLMVEKSYQRLQKTQVQHKSSFNNGWQELGLAEMDLNVNIGSPHGIGRVEDLYVDPNDLDYIYMASRSGGFWRTTDAGLNWLNTTDTLVTSGVYSVTASPSNRDSVLIAVCNPRNSTSHGVYGSSDGGMSWQATSFIPDNLGWGGLGDNSRINLLRYDPLVPNRVYVGTSEGLYRSDDNMLTWAQYLPNANIFTFDFHPTNPDIIYLVDRNNAYGTQGQILISNDAGQTATPSVTMPNYANGQLAVSTSGGCASCVFVAGNSNVWKSIDQGVTFTATNAPAEPSDGFEVSDIDTSVILFGHLAMFRSIDGGASYQQCTNQGATIDSLYIHVDTRDIQCINGIFYIATDGYLARSNASLTSWERLSRGAGIRENYAGGVSQSHQHRYGCGSQDNGTAARRDAGWKRWLSGDGFETIYHPLNHEYIMGSVQYGWRGRSVDGGNSGSWVSSGLQTGVWYSPLLMDPNHQMRFYHFADSVFVTNDFGSSWSYVGSPGVGDINVAGMPENNSDFLIVADGGAVFRSLDAGQTFTPVLGLPNATPSKFAFAPHDDNIIIAVYSSWANNGQKVYLSQNAGLSWTNITGNLGDMPIYSAVIDHTDDHNIYLGAEIGVYTRPLAGGTWTLYNPELPNVTVTELEVMWGTNSLRAITWGRGMWEYTLIGRNDFPNIVTTRIDDMPTDIAPVDSIPQYVESELSYNGTLSSVYVKWSTGAPTFDSTIVMVNTIDSTWRSVTPIPAFFAGTDVYFKVYAVGANNDTTETYKFHYRTKESCLSNGNMTWGTAVTLVDFNTINNATGKLAPYTDYTYSHATTVAQGDDYDLTVNVNTDGNYTVHATAWIDWNQNGTYDDPGEEYALGSAQNTPDGPTGGVPLTITVPTNALLGPTKMRVSARFAAPADPCETNFDGEVEDYRIFVDPICVASTNSIVASACSSYASPDGLEVWTTSGTYQDTLMNAIGCDSVITVDLTINQAHLNNLTTSACDSFSTGGQTYFASGNYQEQYFTAAGCDSTINLDLTINPSYDQTWTASSCFSYEWGDSTYTATGQYSQNLTSINGCDSVLSLDLTITTFPQTTTNTDTSITAVATGVTYQWVDCDDNYMPVANGGNQAYYPTANGNYAVILTDGGCVDTTACVAMTTVGMDENPLLQMAVYPNPIQDELNIVLPQAFDRTTIELIDVTGRLIHQYDERNVQHLSYTWNLAAGTYYLKVSAGQWQHTVALEVLE